MSSKVSNQNLSTKHSSVLIEINHFNLWVVGYKNVKHKSNQKKKISEKRICEFWTKKEMEITYWILWRRLFSLTYLSCKLYSVMCCLQGKWSMWTIASFCLINNSSDESNPKPLSFCSGMNMFQLFEHLFSWRNETDEIHSDYFESTIVKILLRTASNNDETIANEIKYNVVMVNVTTKY